MRFTELLIATESLKKREGDLLPTLKTIFFEGLKKSYKKKTIDEVLFAHKGGSWGKDYFEGGIKAKVLRSPDIRFGFIDFENAEDRYFTKKEIETFSLKNNDILVIKSIGSLDLVGKSQIYKENKKYQDVIASNFLMVLRPNEEVIFPEYLDLFLKSPQSLVWRFDAQKTTTGLRNLNSIGYLNIEIPVPDTIEVQKELFNSFCSYLIGEIDENVPVIRKFYILSKTKESLSNQFTHQLDLLKKIRQQILQNAMQGKLVPQDPNDEPANKLLERIKAEKEQLIKRKKLKRGKPTGQSVSYITDYETPMKWDWCKVDDVLFVTKLAGFEYTNLVSLKPIGEIPVIRAQNVRPYRIEKTNLLFIDEKTSLFLDRCALTKKCLLFTFIGAGIGDVATFNEKERWHLAPNVAKAEPFDGCEDLLNLKYINFFMMSKIGQKEIFKHMKATAQPSLSMSTIRDIDIAIPPLPEQNQIVTKIEQLMQLCDELEQSIQQNQKYTQDLLQVALKEALEQK